MTTKGSRKTRRLMIAAALSVVITAAGATSAQAGLLSGLVVESAPSCAPQPVTQPFRSFGDTASYTLLPRGTFESGTSGWTLSNARVVSGNESFYVHGRGDSKSLSISRGGSATSPTICVGLEHPTMRFFARSSGTLPVLGVSVIVRTSLLGLKVPVPLGAVTPSSSWRPTQRFIVLANLLPLLPGNYTPVSFRFTAVSGNWWIDDVYVDPKKH